MTTLSRRTLLTAAGVTLLPTGLAARSATPLASPVAGGPNLYRALDAATRQLITLGRPVADAYIGNDEATLTDLSGPLLRSFLSQDPVANRVAAMQRNVVAFTFSPANASWIGWNNRAIISGFFHQGTTYGFELLPDTAQHTDHPTGHWTGTILLPGQELAFEVAFTGEPDTLAATLAIPAQGLTDASLDDVRFVATQPVGERAADTAMPLGLTGPASVYRAAYPWGTNQLLVTATFDNSLLAQALFLSLMMPLPDDPTAGTALARPLSLPVRGAWYVGWGGDTELVNYHATVPSQRHAVDIMVWQDGATYRTDGMDNADYLAWGQTVVSPCNGRVVEVVDGQPDGNPARAMPNPAAQAAAATEPAGNHLVIQIGRDQYVLLAHLRQGSITARLGDAVNAGDPLGVCGSSGNSSEPHVHMHVQNQLSYLSPGTQSIRLVFDAFRENGQLVTGQPLRQSTIVEPT